LTEGFLASFGMTGLKTGHHKGCGALFSRGLPGVEEGEDVFGSHGASGAVLLAEEKSAVGIEDGDGRDAAVEGHVILFGNVEILVHAADVHVDDKERFVECGSDFRAVEGFVEDMAIETPVAAEDEENALVGSGGGAKGGGDFGVGISRGRIDFFALEGLAEAGGGTALNVHERPAIASMEPALDEGDEFLFGGGALFQGEGELEDEEVEIRLGIAFLDEVGGKIGEPFGFPGGPEGEFIGKGDGFVVESREVRRGRRAVEAGEGGGVAGEDGSAPLVEGRKVGRLSGSGSGEEEKNKE
jgi:hypothetical protein